MGKTQDNASCQVHLGLGSLILGLAAGCLVWALGGSLQQALGIGALVTMAPFLFVVTMIGLGSTILLLAGAAVTASSVSSSITKRVAGRGPRCRSAR